MRRAVISALFISMALPATAETSPLMRYEAMIVLVPEADGPAQVGLTAVGIARYVTPLTWELTDAANRLLQYGMLPMDTNRTVGFAGEAGQPLLLRMDAGLNGYRVETDVPFAVVASEAHHLRFNRPERDLFLWVAPGGEAFELRAVCESPNEGATLRLLDPAGAVAAEASGEIATWEALAATVGPDAAGRVWRLSIAEAPPTYVDDVDFYLTGDVVPLVSIRADWVEAIASAMHGWEGAAE